MCCGTVSTVWGSLLEAVRVKVSRSATRVGLKAHALRVPYRSSLLEAQLTSMARLRSRLADAHRRASQDWACVYPQKVNRLRQLPLNPPMSNWRVLDVGCGFHYPQLALLSDSVGCIQGVDIEHVFYQDGLRRCISASMNGTNRWSSMKGGMEKWLYYAAYYHHLRSISRRRVPPRGCSLFSYDGTRLPFGDQSFDLLVSNAVLEHVLDMRVLVDECWRVLDDGGCVDMWWHNFFSMSGSHMPVHVRGRLPWGHLTGQLEVRRRDLNRMAPADVVSAFGRRFQILQVIRTDGRHRPAADPQFRSEGTGLLTDDLRNCLGVSDEVLTTTGYVVQAQKTASHVAVTSPLASGL